MKESNKIKALGEIESYKHEVEQIHAFLDDLPERLDFNALRAAVAKQNDPQLARLCYEYLPVTFGRRHGDPSRPWNKFRIALRDENGASRLDYQGNWRDIFQNWEALTLSYPEFVENVVAKFVNASTMDGYNPYRITKDGIDWEVEEPDDPWSYIGYWGDHQIIYLLKLLELSQQFHPDSLADLLRHEIFSYANVPYRIKSFEDLLLDAFAEPESFDEDLLEDLLSLVRENTNQYYRESLLRNLLSKPKVIEHYIRDDRLDEAKLAAFMAAVIRTGTAEAPPGG